MAKEKVTAKLVRIAKTGKGFQLEGIDGWFNATDKSKVYLEKIEVGTVVEVDYFSKGTFRTAIVIAPAKTQEPVKEEPKTTSEYKCSICGAPLKTNKYPTCWDCKNKPAQQKPKEEKKAEPPKEESKIVYTCKSCGKELKDNKYEVCFECSQKGNKSTNFNKTSYGSPEDIAGKEIGCAANCAATILSGRQEDPETLLEMFRTLMNGILDHIRMTK
jgi:DNA-directed RNA polymerase subunit RPC12/RpoP